MSSTEAVQNAPTPRALAAAAIVGVISALWALFQWGELLVARAGGIPFCAINETLNCHAVWDSDFAHAIHEATKIPIAGWGLIWGFVAFVLPLIALTDRTQLQRGVLASIKLYSISGLVAVATFGVASFVAGALCMGCLGTYVLVALYALITLTSSRGTGMPEIQRGIALALGLSAAGYAALFVPGMRTPARMAAAGDAIKAAAHSTQGSASPAPATSSATSPAAPTASPFAGPPTGDAERDGALQALMNEMPPDQKQPFADTLQAYADAKPTAFTGKIILGDAKAPVQFVEWTDVLCGHCAALHDTLKSIQESVPAGSFSIVSKYFPLDQQCNPNMPQKGDNDARCTGAKAQICLESHPRAFEAQELLFANQQTLTTDKMLTLLEPFMKKAELQRCIAAPATAARLREDIDAGMKLDIQGTPLILLNGKQVMPFGALLYALVLTGGKTQHPAFASLPTPRPLQPHAH